MSKRNHGITNFVGTYASQAQLPNVSGATKQIDSLQVNDTAFVTGVGLFTCTTSTKGAAVWQLGCTLSHVLIFTASQTIPANDPRIAGWKMAYAIGYPGAGGGGGGGTGYQGGVIGTSGGGGGGKGGGGGGCVFPLPSLPFAIDPTQPLAVTVGLGGSGGPGGVYGNHNGTAGTNGSASYIAQNGVYLAVFARYAPGNIVVGGGGASGGGAGGIPGAGTGGAGGTSNGVAGFLYGEWSTTEDLTSAAGGQGGSGSFIGNGVTGATPTTCIGKRSTLDVTNGVVINTATGGTGGSGADGNAGGGGGGGGGHGGMGYVGALYGIGMPALTSGAGGNGSNGGASSTTGVGGSTLPGGNGQDGTHGRGGGGGGGAGGGGAGTTGGAGNSGGNGGKGSDGYIMIVRMQ